MDLFDIIVVVCLIIVSFAFCSIYSSIDTIKSIMQKRRHKKIFKKAKKENRK